MPGRNKPLITRNGIPDPQAYNPQTGQWESFIGVSWGKTAGGLYVPIRVDDQGRQEVTLSGNIVEEGILRQVEIAAGATAELDVRNFSVPGSDGTFVRIDDKVQFMLLVQQTNDHTIECKYYYRIGGYSSPTVTSKSIPLERRASGFYVSGLHSLYASAGFIIRLTNKSTTTQTYPSVRVNLYRRMVSSE